MNLAAFETLRAVLVHGNFTAAGAAVGCTPSAVSLQMKHLEQYLGQTLFDRSTRTVKPTPLALEIASAAAEFGERVQALRQRTSLRVEGTVRLGVLASMQCDILPSALKALRQKHPALNVRVPPYTDTDELLMELRAGRVDAAVVARPDNGGSTRLIWRDIWRQPFVLIAPPDAMETDLRSLLKNHGWISYDTSLPGGKVAARQVRKLVPNITPSLEIRSMDAIVSMVALGMGVTVIPQPRRPLIQAYGVKEFSLGRSAPSRRISLVWRRPDEGNRKLEVVATALASPDAL